MINATRLEDLSILSDVDLRLSRATAWFSIAEHAYGWYVLLAIELVIEILLGIWHEVPVWKYAGVRCQIQPKL
jgi:hypothetical protein